MNKMVVIATVLVIFLASSVSAVIINEFTVDPQTDWDHSGSATSSDEWIELYNPSNESLDLTNWTIIINDSASTNATIQLLQGTIQPEGYLVVMKPQGGLNNDGQLHLLNSLVTLIDSVTYGTWDDGNKSDNAPSGGANSVQEECVARIPNGQDTNYDNKDFKKTRCTFQKENGIIPENEQGLNATISGLIKLKILPRWLEFGTLQPASTNNPALNGPITFNATGSGTNVSVEITEILGSPFAEGLKIDGHNATGSNWLMACKSTKSACTFDIKSAVPTLDVPEDAAPGPVQGSIVYTISGPTP